METLLFIIGIILATMILAMVGHLLWIFYRFLFRSIVRLLARSRGKEEVDLPALNLRVFTYLFSVEGLKYWAYLGGVIVAVAVILLIKEYIAALLLIKYVQLAGIALVTALTYITGWKLCGPATSPSMKPIPGEVEELRTDSSRHRVLGNALMIIGAILLPVNFWYYQEFILLVDRHQAYLVGFICTAVYLFTAIRRSSLLFSYFAPISFHVSTLLILEKLDYELEIYVFVSALLAVLYPLAADYLQKKWQTQFKSPLIVAAIGGLLFAALAFLNLEHLANIYLPVYLFIAAALILNKIAQLKFDPRYLFLGIPIVAIVYLRHLEAFDLAHYWFGMLFSSLALMALGIWWIFLTRFPNSPYKFYFQLLPLTLLTFALPVDIMSYLYLVDKLGSLQRFRYLFNSASLSVEALGNTWQGIHIAIYYLSYFSTVSLVILISTGLTAISSGILAAKNRSRLVGFYGITAFLCCFTIGLIKFRHPLLYLDTYFLWYLGLTSLFAGCLRMISSDKFRFSKKTTVLVQAFEPGLYIHAVLTFLLTYILAGVYFEMEVESNFDYYFCTLSLLGIIVLYLARNLPKDSFLRKLHIAGALMIVGPLMLSSFIDWTSSTFFIMLTFFAGLFFLVYGWYVEEKSYLAIGSLSIFSEALYAFLTVETGQIFIKVLLLLLGIILIFIGVYLKKEKSLAIFLAGSLVFSSGGVGIQAAEAAKNDIQDDPHVRYLVDLIHANPNDQLIRARFSGYIKKNYKNWRQISLPGLPPPTVPDRFRRSFFRDDLASITGIRAIEGTLQLDAMRQQVILEQAPTIDISSLTPLRIASHDYAGMLEAQQQKGKFPEILGPVLSRAEGVERIIPDDKIYLRFPDVESFLQFLTVVDTSIAPALNMLTRSLTLEGAGSLFEHLFALSLKELEQISLFIQGITIVIGDPSIHLGSDITLIFETADDVAARRIARMPAFQKAAFLKTYGRFVVISNNQQALEQIGNIEHPLAEAADFLYMKSLHVPATHGFIYLGEAFVERLISPEFRIKDLRRHNCKLNLLKLHHATLLYLVDGHPPESVSIENLVKGHYLDAEPADLNEGSPSGETTMYHFDPATQEWRHDIYGKEGDFTPLIDLSIRRIRPVERDLYDRFRSLYQRYFTRYIDPIGIGLSFEENGFTLHTVILPLIDDPLYESIVNTLGRETQEEVAPGGSKITSAIPSNYGISVLLRSPVLKDILRKHWWWRQYNYYQREMQPYLKEMTLFGPELFLGLGDFGFAEQNNGRRTSESASHFPSTLKEFSQLSFEIPVVMIQPLTNEERGREYLRRLFHRMRSTAVAGVPVLSFNVLGNINLYGSVYNNLLILSSSLARQKEILGQPSTKSQPLLAENLQEQSYHLTAVLQSAYLQQLKPHLFRLIQEQLHLSCKSSLATLQNLLDLYVARYGSVVKDDDIHSLVSFGKLPKIPLCPEGGHYYISGGKQAVCSVDGSLEAYQEQGKITGDFFLNPFFTRLQRLIAQLKFTEEGIETKVQVELLRDE